MDELKAIFGDESIDYATFEARLAENKDVKLVDLKQGGFVEKYKFDKLSGEYNKCKDEFEKWKVDNDVSKYADYDSLKAEVEQLRAEKIEAGYMSEAAAQGVDEKFREFVVSKCKGGVTKEKDFKSCLSEYLKENQQFIAQPQQPTYFRGAAAIDVSKGGASAPSIAQKLNKKFRGE